MVRPLKEIDAKQVELLAGCGCTTTEIGLKLDCSNDTLERRFAAELEKGKSNGRTSLRGKQFELAMKGSIPMLIWLGKNMLGQSDKIEQNVHGNISLLGTLTEAEIDDRLAKTKS